MNRDRGFGGHFNLLELSEELISRLVEFANAGYGKTYLVKIDGMIIADYYAVE